MKIISNLIIYKILILTLTQYNNLEMEKSNSQNYLIQALTQNLRIFPVIVADIAVGMNAFASFICVCGICPEDLDLSQFDPTAAGSSCQRTYPHGHILISIGISSMLSAISTKL